MDEKPVEALRKKRDNSISKCWGLMASGDVKAVVSAGNTGAMVASALFNAKMFLPGVRRPGIAAIFPSHQGPIVIIDVGANMNAKPEDLYQYGVMGSIYAETILGVTEPKIGLLNVGTEEEKGTDLTKATRALFQQQPAGAPVRRQRRGPRHLRGPRPRGRLRGVRRATSCSRRARGPSSSSSRRSSRSWPGSCPASRPAPASRWSAGLSGLKTRFEYQEFGGGPLLGIQGACIICHGASGCPRHQERPARRRHAGRGQAQSTDRRATGRRAERGGDDTSGSRAPPRRAGTPMPSSHPRIAS